MPSLGRTVLACLALVTAVLAVYGQVARHEFIPYDTGLYLTSNARVLAGLAPESLRWALVEAHAANWHPLTWWSHMLDVEVFGLRPAGHHLENVAWHAANAVLVFLAFSSMTGRIGRSFAVALLFALHPLHVESVAWIVERKDVLSTFFGLLAILAYVAWARRGGFLRYLAAFVALALGLMAKPMLVTWPCVLLLLDLWPLGRARLGFARLMLEKLPFVALSCASSVLTVWAQSSEGAIQHLAQLSIADRIGNALLAYIAYLRQTLWPRDLAFYYPHPGEHALGVVLAAGAVLAALVVVAFRLRRGAPWLFVGLAWFFGTLVPVIGLVQVGGQGRADRYTYVPLIGLFVAFVWDVAGRFQRARAPRWMPIAACTAVTLVLAALTARQVATWKDVETLSQHALAVDPRNHVAHDLLGAHFVERGELERGIAELEAALAIEPGDTDALDNLSVALLRQGRLAEAEATARRALELAPWRATSHAHLGAALQMQRRFGESHAELAEALRLAPDHVGAATNTGLVLEQLGRTSEAVEAFERALTLKPDYAPARLSLARLLVRRGDLERAERELQSALAHDPGDVEAWRGLARVESARGKPRVALEALENVLRARPDWPLAQAEVAWLLATSPDSEVANPERALALAERAAELSERSQPAILDTLAAAYAASRYFLDAVATGTQAAELARALGDGELAARIEARVAGYRVGRAASAAH